MRPSAVPFTLQDIAKLTVVSRSHGRACLYLLRAAMRQTGASWVRVWDEQSAGYAKIGWREPRERAVRGGGVSCVGRGTAVCSLANVAVCVCRSAWAARRLSRQATWSRRSRCWARGLSEEAAGGAMRRPRSWCGGPGCNDGIELEDILSVSAA